MEEQTAYLREAFSDHQGFIEGSLRSVEETLFKMGIGRSNKVER